MALSQNDPKKIVKNEAGFHAHSERIQHQKGQPTPAKVNELDDDDSDQHQKNALMKLATKELRIRAESLGIKDTDIMDHDGLVESLVDYRRDMIDPRTVRH